jgi:N-acetylglucosamine repressor
MSSIRRKPQAVAAIEHALLRCVRTKGQVSRGELSQELDLVQSTIGVYVDRLVRDGYLRESCPAERGLGRPPLLVELNPRKGRFLGIDFHARQLRGISVDFAQQPLERLQFELSPPVTTAEVLDVLHHVLEQLIDGRADDVLGIGIATPGYVDPDRGIGREYVHIADWRDVPVADVVRRRWSLPVFIENNIRAIALAEYWFGQGRGLDNFVCLGVRSGISAGVMLHGQLFRGASQVAGEVGQWRLPPPLSADGGSPPTIEEQSSLTALLRQATGRLAAGEPSLLAGSGTPLTSEALVEAVGARDRLAVDLVERAADVHAWMVHQIDCVLDPQRILVAGPLAETSFYWERLQEACRQYQVPRLVTRICRSELGPFGGALGAAALAVQQWKPQR